MRINLPSFSPEIPEGNTGLSEHDILEKLNEEPIETEKEEPAEEKLDTSDDTDAIEIKEEEEEPEVEIKEEKDLEFEDIPRRQEILAKYPNFDKDFPSVLKAVYRENEYAEVFPTIADAKEAQNEIANFKQFENDLLQGNLESVLQSVKNTDAKAYQRMSGNLLQTLAKVDQNAYYNTVNHVIKTALKGSFDLAKKNSDDQLEIASQLLHKFLYGTPEITVDALPQQEQVNPDREKFNTERTEFAKQQLNTAVTDVVSRANNLVRSSIDKHIDPSNTMTPYVKAKAMNDVMEMLDKEISSDTRFRQVLDRKWQNARSNSYNEQSKTDIRNALISKAKTVLPQIIKSVRASALKGQATRTREAAESKNEKPIERGRPATPKTQKGKIPRGMSTREYLEAD